MKNNTIIFTFVFIVLYKVFINVSKLSSITCFFTIYYTYNIFIEYYMNILRIIFPENLLLIACKLRSKKLINILPYILANIMFTLHYNYHYYTNITLSNLKTIKHLDNTYLKEALISKFLVSTSLIKIFLVSLVILILLSIYNSYGVYVSIKNLVVYDNLSKESHKLIIKRIITCCLFVFVFNLLYFLCFIFVLLYVVYYIPLTIKTVFINYAFNWRKNIQTTIYIIIKEIVVYNLILASVITHNKNNDNKKHVKSVNSNIFKIIDYLKYFTNYSNNILIIIILFINYLKYLFGNYSIMLRLMNILSCIMFCIVLTNIMNISIFNYNLVKPNVDDIIKKINNYTKINKKEYINLNYASDSIKNVIIKDAIESSKKEKQKYLFKFKLVSYNIYCTIYNNTIYILLY